MPLWAEGLPLAAGLAMADQRLRPGAITACFFGEGAVGEGAFHETMNLAEIWKLPMLFVCENNLYAMGVPLDISEAETDIYRKAQAYRMPSEQVDGMDPIKVEAAARRAVEHVRGGGGPYFLECRTYRFRAHSMFDAQAYRTRDEIAEWKQHDPIERLRTWMVDNRQITAAELENIEARDRRRDRRRSCLCRGRHAGVGGRPGALRADGQRGAGDSRMNTPAKISKGAAKSASKSTSKAPKKTPAENVAPERMTYREACRQGIREALTKDSRTFLMGEDVGRYGGCYAVTKGLLEEFGPERIIDTPLAELGFTGAGVGAALGGLRPIVEIMTCNFSLLALDQIMNNAATIAHMSGGQFAVPLVIRMATGAGRQLAAQHSHSLEGWYAHIPGLKVLVPGTVEDARHMLAAALADPNPVLIFEHIVLYNAEGDLDPAVQSVDIEHAKVRRAGTDVSLITYGNSLPKCLAAAQELAALGIDAEVIDLRVLRPLDTATLIESVSRTRRCVIVDEGWRSGSISAEIAARLAEEAFFELDAPIRRVCGREVPVPFAMHMEEASLPQIADIVASASALVHKA